MITQYKSSEHKNTCSLVLYGEQPKSVVSGHLYVDPEHTIRYAPRDDMDGTYKLSTIWPHDIIVKYTPYGSDFEVSVPVIEATIRGSGTSATLVTPRTDPSGVIAKFAWNLPAIK